MKNMSIRIKQTFTIRNIVIAVLIITIVLSLFSFALYQAMRNSIVKQVGVSAQGIASTTALLIMEDTAAYKEQMASGDTQSEYYRQTQKILMSVAADSNVRSIFTERRLNEDSVEHVLSSNPPESPDFIAPGTKAANDHFREYTYMTQRPNSGTLINDPDRGLLVPAYAPILDGEKSCIGIVGVEMDASPFFQSFYQNLVIIVFGAILIFSLIFAFMQKITPHLIAMIIRDELTSAYNRNYLKWFISGWARRSKRTGIPVSVLMLDIDNLDTINSKYGMEFGDQVLQYFSKRVMNTLRKTDCYARYGKDEFLVVLPGTFVDIAGQIAQRVRGIAANNHIYNVVEQLGVTATVSVGAAGLDPMTNSVEKMIQAAEQAMEVAKEHGNCVALYTQSGIHIMDPTEGNKRRK